MKKNLIFIVGAIVLITLLVSYSLVKKDTGPDREYDSASPMRLIPQEEPTSGRGDMVIGDTLRPDTAIGEEAFHNTGHNDSITIAEQHNKANVTTSRLTQLESRVGLSFQSSYNEKRLEGKRTTRENMFSVINGGGSSYRLMEFSRGIGALLAMFEATGSPEYLSEVLDLSEKLISKAQLGKSIQNNPNSFKDEYYGWANINKSGNSQTGDHLREYPLYESYLFRYLAKTVYLIRNGANIHNTSSLLVRGNKLQDYIEKNGWEKWYVRGEKNSSGCFPHLFRSRAHMTSHWAMVALYLREVTNDQTKRDQYNHLLTLYNKQLKDNFNLIGNAYKWNMTWDSAWPIGTDCNPATKKSIVQDVSHGNHVVTYIIESYELSQGEWTQQDIQFLSNTFKEIVYDKAQQRFNGDLNGKFIANMADGLRMSDGFIKLARYDKEILALIRNVRANQYGKESFNFYEAQYVAELILAEKYLE